MPFEWSGHSSNDQQQWTCCSQSRTSALPGKICDCALVSGWMQDMDWHMQMQHSTAALAKTEICLNSLLPSQTKTEFTVRYQAAGQEVWDNNSGWNYHTDLIPILKLWRHIATLKQHATFKASHAELILPASPFAALCFPLWLHRSCCRHYNGGTKTWKQQTTIQHVLAVRGSTITEVIAGLGGSEKSHFGDTAKQSIS